MVKSKISDLVVSRAPPFEFIPGDHHRRTWAYISPVPAHIISSEPICVGIDEAGRGPVLGPMVYCALYVPVRLKDFRNLDFKEISDKMMYPRRKRNLNQMAHDATIQIIQSILNQKLKLVEVFVDAVGPSKMYEKYLCSKFSGVKFTVKEKADSLFPCVSAASICAKVIRDVSLDLYQQQCKTLYPTITQPWGSGYPSDPNTVKYMRLNIDYVFGYPDIVRFSWSTTTKIIKEKCAIVNYNKEDSVATRRISFKAEICTPDEII